MPDNKITDIYLVCLSDFYYANRIFDIHSPQNRDHAYEPYHLLRQTFQERGVRLNTYDFFKKHGDSLHALLFADIPDDMERIVCKHPGVPKYLLLMESEIISPNSWILSRHDVFEKIFTWSDKLMGNSRYIKIQVPSYFPSRSSLVPFGLRKLCVMIAGNKRSCFPMELYSERVSAIRWFEANHPDEFDLYGFGWKERQFVGSKPIRALNRIRVLRRLTAPHYPSYRGAVTDKLTKLKEYRFAICYENVRDVPGYITEKIFDCFFAGCVPVYWGANNVTDYISKECFIDRRDFSGMDDLYEFICSMDEDAYQGYLSSIDEFLTSPKAYPFTAEFFAKTIVEGMLD